MKFSETVGNEPMNKRLHFSGDPDYRIDKGIVFRVRQYTGSYGKWCQPTALREAAEQGMH